MCPIVMMPIPEAVTRPFFSQSMHDGAFKSNESHEKAVVLMVNELLRWSEALRALRP